MAYYFLYKHQNIATIGGVLPKTDDDKITLGICENDGYYLGSVEDPTNISDIKDYFVAFISEEQAEGFKILHATEIIENSDPDNMTTRELNETELANQAAATKMMVKYQLRDHLATEFSDIPDMLADANKKYELLERIFMEIGIYLIQNQSIPSEVTSKYLPYFQKYADRMIGNNISIRADIEPDPVQFYDDLLNKTDVMNDMVNNIYINAT